MKKLIVLSSLAILFSGASAFAARKLDKNHPCAKMKAACVAAGFTGDHKDGKSLRKDCMDKLSDGVEVPGVTANADDIAACKKQRVQHLEHRKEMEGNYKEAMPGSK